MDRKNIFIKRLNNTFTPDEFTVLKYTHSNTNATVLHNICKNIINIRPGNLIKRGCPCCNAAKRELEKKQIGFNYLNEKLQLRDDGTEYSIIDFINTTKFTLKHNCGHIINTSTAHFFVRGDKCRKCNSIDKGLRARKSEEEFKSQIPEILTGEIKMLSPYIKDNEKIHFLHTKCGREFWRTPSNIIQSDKPCPLCSRESAKTRLKTVDLLKQQIKEKYNDEYTLIGEYLGTHEKTTFFHLKCKKEITMTPNNLLHGYGCHYCRSSKGEKAIRSYLIKKGIEFKEQQTFNDCISIKGRKLKFDFFLEEHNILIEYDGEQHFSMDKFYDKTDIDLDNQKENDKIKDDYAEEHSIKLIRIPYWDFDNIKEILDRDI